MNEIAFRVGSTVKWISGITSQTTCKDIIISLVKTENLSPSAEHDEESVYRNFVLVENWREVSKVLPSTSLILKIWNAWGDEQPNVSFSVKRVKHLSESRHVVTDNEKAPTPDQTSKKRLRRKNSRNGKSGGPPVDTLHPKALARNQQIISNDIQQQMKKIINQGKKIRKHLENLQEIAKVEEVDKKADVSKDKECNLDGLLDKTQPIVLDDHDAFNDSGNVTEGSETSNNNNTESETKFIDHEVCSTLGTDLKSISQTVTNALVHSIETDSFVECQALEHQIAAESSLVELTKENHGDETNSLNSNELEPKESDLSEVILMFEKLHRLNQVLESKQEQIVTMKYECDSLNLCSGNSLREIGNISHPTASFNLEVTRYREINSSLLTEISKNNCTINQIEVDKSERKKLICQLEFDVNVIERESKRLQSDLKTIEDIECPVNMTERVNMHTIDMSNQTSELYGIAPVMSQRPGSLSHTSLSPSDTDRPDSSENGPGVLSRDKSVRFSDQEDVCSLGSVGFDSPLPHHSIQITLPVASPRSILKTEVSIGKTLNQKSEYGSDSGSDTGVSSLSSTEGDYELSTLV